MAFFERCLKPHTLEPPFIYQLNCPQPVGIRKYRRVLQSEDGVNVSLISETMALYKFKTVLCVHILLLTKLLKSLLVFIGLACCYSLLILAIALSAGIQYISYINMLNLIQENLFFPQFPIEYQFLDNIQLIIVSNKREENHIIKH